MTGYDFHPRAVNDLDEIWGFIAADNLDAAVRMIGEILAAIEALVAASAPMRDHWRQRQCGPRTSNRGENICAERA
jgi:plasmid stabilization system protein ParE